MINNNFSPNSWVLIWNLINIVTRLFSTFFCFFFYFSVGCLCLFLYIFRLEGLVALSYRGEVKILSPSRYFYLFFFVRENLFPFMKSESGAILRSYNTGLFFLVGKKLTINPFSHVFFILILISFLIRSFSILYFFSVNGQHTSMVYFCFFEERKKKQVLWDFQFNLKPRQIPSEACLARRSKTDQRMRARVEKYNV
jgi:hypothetical protein